MAAAQPDIEEVNDMGLAVFARGWTRPGKGCSNWRLGTVASNLPEVQRLAAAEGASNAFPAIPAIPSRSRAG